MDSWLAAYARRRYGAASPAAIDALRVIARTAYAVAGGHGEFPHNSAVCARPSLNPNQRARGYTSTAPGYNPTELTEAWRLLLQAAPACAASDAYLYDVVDVGRQVLADLGTRYHQALCGAWARQDADEVKRYGDKMLALIQGMDDLVGTRKELLLGAWLEDARRWGTTEGEKDLCEWNARTLLTTWTNPQSHGDYANRHWAGLLRDFYYQRWSMWLAELQQGMDADWTIDVKAARARIQAWEYAWARRGNPFPTKPRGDAVAIATNLLERFGEDADDPDLELGPYLREATAADFHGRWRYPAEGATWEREVLPNGSLGLYRNGQPYGGWKGFTWTYEKAAIILRRADGTVFGRHVLRDKDTLLFIGEAWPPARRVP
jgi:alpha-N-acetylglucosaminidase